MKEGINLNPGDPNYDLFKLACHCSAKRLFPNFSFQDAPFNIRYYKPGRPETEIAYMGCRTRVIGNVHDPEREISNGRGNLSFTSINLPRLAIRAKGDISRFFEDLDAKISLVIDQLLERFEISAAHVYNFRSSWGGRVDRQRQALVERRSPRGAAPRDAVHRLYRSCRNARRPHRRTPRAERAGAEPRP